MKYVRIIFALLLSAGVMMVARSSSRGRPEAIVAVSFQVEFEMTTVPKVIEHQMGTITLVARNVSDSTATMRFRFTEDPSAPAAFYERKDMDLVYWSDTAAVYATNVIAGDKGGKLYYHFELNNGRPLARFMDVEQESFVLRYIGEVPLVVLLTHLLFIFITVFGVAMAIVHALPVVSGRVDLRSMMLWIGVATVACFIGGYPAGIPMNWYAFGGTWEGIPFGTDATDNKTQLLFVYLLFALFSGCGTLRGKSSDDLFGERTMGHIGVGSFLVMLFIYLIPHSIQFSAELTYTFCYAWTLILLLWYLFGLRRRRAARSS